MRFSFHLNILYQPPAKFTHGVSTQVAGTIQPARWNRHGFRTSCNRIVNKVGRLGSASRAFGALLLVGCLNGVRAANVAWTAFPTSIKKVEATAAPAGVRARPFI